VREQPLPAEVPLSNGLKPQLFPRPSANGRDHFQESVERAYKAQLIRDSKREVEITQKVRKWLSCKGIAIRLFSVTFYSCLRILKYICSDRMDCGFGRDFL